MSHRRSLYDEAAKYWDSVSVIPIDVCQPLLDDFVSQLRHHFSKVRSGWFRVSSTYAAHPDDRVFEYLKNSRLFTHPDFKRHFGISAVATPLINFPSEPPYHLPGILGLLLLNGGACSPGGQRGMVCFDRALAALLEVGNGDLNNLEAWDERSAWCDFFCGIAWDYSLVMRRQGASELFCLLVTDTD